jgi:DNA-directed RNA polymerase specialized sigma subunit
MTLEEKISKEDFLESTSGADGLSSGETKLDVSILVEAFKEALKIMPEKRRMILLLRFDVIDATTIPAMWKKEDNKTKED